MSRCRDVTMPLAGPYDRGKTEQSRERFLEIQVAIEAIGRAIDDEAGWQGSGL